MLELIVPLFVTAIISLTNFDKTLASGPTDPTVNNDGCTQLMSICWKECGQPEFFSRGSSHCQTDWNYKVKFCLVPPGCECNVPSMLGVINKCLQDTCKPWGVEGGLDWCNNCAYNCGGYQEDCINNGRFCLTSARCASLDMCEQLTLSPTREPTSHPTIEPTSHPTEKPTSHPTREPTEKPTREPTSHPTIEPTPSPSSVKNFTTSSSPNKQDQRLAIVIFFTIMMGGFFTCCILFTFYSRHDSKNIKRVSRRIEPFL